MLGISVAVGIFELRSYSELGMLPRWNGKKQRLRQQVRVLTPLYLSRIGNEGIKG